MLQKLIFDTSAINALVDGGSQSDALARGLGCGFEIILTAMSADEIISTKSPERREALLKRFGQLLSNAICIWPPHEIVRLLVAAHHFDPSRFEWTKVDVRSRAYEQAIPAREFDDPLCIAQRKQQFEVQRKFDRMWKDLRPHLDAIFMKDPSQRPADFGAAAAIAVREGGVLWAFGQALYEHVSCYKPTEQEMREFMEHCPPFRAACYALVMAWYKGSLRISDGTPSAGRNDLLMATYLPYCDRFITDDWAQCNELRQVAAAARVSCEVISYPDFENSFEITK